MKTWNRFRPYRRGDLLKVWRDLRPEDLREYHTVGLTDPQLIEDYLMVAGRRLQTWDTESGPMCILGVTPWETPEVGLIWAVATEATRPRWRFAVRNTDRILRDLGKGYLLLSNFKDTRNTQQINWLRRLGFVFFRTEENFGGCGYPFHQFVRIVQ